MTEYTKIINSYTVDANTENARSTYVTLDCWETVTKNSLLSFCYLFIFSMFTEAQYWFCCGGLGSFQMIGSELGGVGQKGQERC